MTAPVNPFRYFNSSPEVIRLTVMMYVKYPLSLRNVEDLLHERGIDLCHETVRHWWNRFGPMFAAEIRRKRSAHLRQHTQWRWHLDEVYVKINGEMHYLWRAVDHEGEVLEAIATKHRDKAAALKLMKRLMKRYGRPKAVVTDGLRSYGAALTELGIDDRREVGQWLNNRAENSHQREPKETLDEIRAEQGADVFEAQYQQNPGASESGLLRWEDVPTYEVAPTRDQCEQVVISWDTGNTPFPTSDYSVGTVWGYYVHRWHLLHLYRGQWDAVELGSWVRNAITQWRATFVVIEDYGSGTSLIQTLWHERGRADWHVQTGCLLRSWKPRIDKPTRFAAQVERLVGGKYLFPATAPWLAPLRRELLAFPNPSAKDDQVDSIVQFLEWATFGSDGARIERGGRRPQGRFRQRILTRQGPLISLHD